MAFTIPDRLKPLAVVAFLLAVAAAALVVMDEHRHRVPEPSPADNGLQRQLYSVIGRVLAEETSRMLGGKGEIVVVATGDEGLSPDARAADCMQILRRAFLEGIRSTDVRVKEELLPSGKPAFVLPRERLDSLVRQNPGAAAVVSLVGQPVLSDGEIAALNPKSPPLVVFTVMLDGLKPLLQSGKCRLAVTFRIGAPEVEAQNPMETYRQWFDRYYQVLTPEKAGVLP